MKDHLSTRRLVRTVSLCFLITLLLPMTAMADDWDLRILGQWVTTSEDEFSQLDEGPGIYLGLERRLSERWGVELGLGWNRLEGWALSATVDWTRLELEYDPNLGRPQPDLDDPLPGQTPKVGFDLDPVTVGVGVTKRF